MSVDSLGDFLTVIRNGVMASKPFVLSPYSGLKHRIGQILKDEGYIADLAVQQDDRGHKSLKISLKYKDGESVIHHIKRISKPGLRIYESVVRFKPVIGGLGIAIITTHKGVMTSRRARQLNVGGEVLCAVW
jgi:small subunit ribosomal protein S8